MVRPRQRSSAVTGVVAIVLLVTACTPAQGVKYGDSLASPLVSPGARLSIPRTTAPPPSTLHSAPTDAAVRTQLAGLRVPFIANEGQVDAQVAYYAPTFAGTLFVTQQGELVYALPGRTFGSPHGRRGTSPGPGWTLTETLRGGRVRPVGQDRSTAGVSSFLGNDPAQWRAELATYEQVSLGEVWPGVTVALRARGRSLEKVFTVHPGGAVGRIRVRVAGAQALTVDAEGALVAGTGLGAVTFTAPVAYQDRDGVRRPVAVAYRPQGVEYGFRVGAYDPDLPLVIDPLLQSTYLGGSSSDVANALAIHPTTGDVYVAGSTGSSNFPGTAGGAQPVIGIGDATFVARLPSTLTSLTQATYLGGSGSDEAFALAIHPTTGDVYVAGDTTSSNFPGTLGGAQPLFGGGSVGNSDAFVARLTADLTSLTQATYLGGSGTDQVNALGIHPTTGDVYVAGRTYSPNFPGTLGGAQPTFGGGADAFIARLTATLTSLIQATYLGGIGGDPSNEVAFNEALALAIHPTTGDVYVAGRTISLNFPGTLGGVQPTYGGGQDAFVARLNSRLTSLIQATYLGGRGVDQANALAIDPATGDVYVAGGSNSTNFPGTAGGAQSTLGDVVNTFVARLTGSLDLLIQATYLGIKYNEGYSLAIHPMTGDIYVAGYTNSPDFDGTSGGVQPTYGGAGDAFIARLTASLTSLIQATYLGGSNFELAYGLATHPTTGDIYVAGWTSSSNFPGTAGGAQPLFGGGSVGNFDAFIARLTSSLRLVDGPDLTLAKTHSGNFTRGQVGATYTMTVSNVGTAATGGTVTVADILPTGLIATALSGSGWSCTRSTVTCTRNDALANGSSYPAITLTVTVAINAPNSVTNTVTVSGGGDVNTDNNAANDPTTVTFADVLTSHPFFQWIEALFAAGITGGCSTSPPQYCPDDGVTRDQMAIFLLRGIHGAGYQPPPATGTMFTDVPMTHPFATWIEQLAREGITGGCSTSPPQYCPDAGVTRGQMAVFLLRAKHGAGYDPPAATGRFTDVPVTDLFAKWIEQLAREAITGGCGPTTYCPDATVTRGQMAVFLVRAFNLPL